MASLEIAARHRGRRRAARGARRAGLGRLGLPSLLLYLGIGILLGESVLGIQFSDAPLTESLGLAALVLILVEGGLTTRWAAVRPSLGVGIALSTVAVAVSIGVVGVALHLLLDLDWRTAFLWGAVLSSTDAAAVFSVLRGVGCHATAGRDAGAGVRVERRARSCSPWCCWPPPTRSPGSPRCWWSTSWPRAGSSAGCSGSAGRGRCGAARCPSTGLYPLAAHRRVRARLLGGPVRARLRPARHLRRRAGAGQLRPAAPRRRPLVRRGHGLAGPDRAVRAARAVRLAAPAARRAGAGAGRRGGAASSPRGRSRCWRRRCRSGCRGASRRSCPGPGCAARCRSCSR